MKLQKKKKKLLWITFFSNSWFPRYIIILKVITYVHYLIKRTFKQKTCVMC